MLCSVHVVEQRERRRSPGLRQHKVVQFLSCPATCQAGISKIIIVHDSLDTNDLRIYMYTEPVFTEFSLNGKHMSSVNGPVMDRTEVT